MTDMTVPPLGNRRVQRTRNALRTAFRRLILERGYGDISVADVAALADVGRSTFYEHYSSLDDLLTQSLEHHFAVLSEAGLASQQEPVMAGVLQHFWENRRMANALFASGASRVLQASLSERIESVLLTKWPGPSKGQAFRRKLLALQLAAGQLTVIAAWLSGRISGGAQEVAETLRQSSRAAAVGTFSPAP